METPSDTEWLRRSLLFTFDAIRTHLAAGVAGAWGGARNSSAAGRTPRWPAPAPTHAQYPLSLQVLITGAAVLWAWVGNRCGGLLAPYTAHMTLDWLLDPVL